MKLFALSVILVAALLPQYNASPINTLIAGGEDSLPGEFPYFVAVQITNFNLTLASGVLVEYGNKQFIVTGARRVWVYDKGDYEPERITLVAGDHSFKESSGNEQARKTNRVITHPDYYPLSGPGLPRPQNMEPDIAIIALTENFVLNDFVKPIRLPEINQTSEASGVIMGWGGKTEKGDYDQDYTYLQKLNVSISSHEDCLRSYRSHPDFHPGTTQQCVEGSAAGGNALCYSDLGGPVVSHDGVLQGILSYPESCINVHPEYPDVMVAIGTYVEWIQRTAGDL